MLLSKAGFKPDQPRMPRGLPHGGRWVRVGGDWEGIDTLTTGSLPEGAPKVPDESPPSTRDKNQVARSVARYIFIAPAFDLLAEIAGWLKEHAGNAIVAYLEPAKPLKELQAAISKDGYQIRAGTLPAEAFAFLLVHVLYLFYVFVLRLNSAAEYRRTSTRRCTVRPGEGADG